MKIGLMVLFSDLSHLPQDQVFSEILEEIDYAEELGFDSSGSPIITMQHRASLEIRCCSPAQLANVLSK